MGLGGEPRMPGAIASFVSEWWDSEAPGSPGAFKALVFQGFELTTVP